MFQQDNDYILTCTDNHKLADTWINGKYKKSGISKIILFIIFSLGKNRKEFIHLPAKKNKPKINMKIGIL